MTIRKKTAFQDAFRIALDMPVSRINQVILASGTISVIVGDAPSVDVVNDEIEWTTNDACITLGWPDHRQQLQVTVWREPPDNERPLPPVLAAVASYCKSVDLPFREDRP